MTLTPRANQGSCQKLRMASNADAPGMTAGQNALGLLTYSATNTLVELPSGWLADTIGRKKILVASALLWGLGYMTHCFGSFYWVIVGECVIALGVSAGSGSDEALIFETARELLRLKGSEVRRPNRPLHTPLLHP